VPAAAHPWTIAMTCKDARRAGVFLRGTRALRVGVLLLVLTTALPSFAQTATPFTWSAQLRSTAYFYQDVTETGRELDLAPLYEHFDVTVGQLAAGRLDFRVSGRYATDLADEGAVFTEDHLYAAYAGLSFDRFDTRVRLGRQFLQEGTNRHTLDGAWISVRPHRLWRVHLWGGGQAPTDRSFEAGELSDDGAYGVRVVGQVARRARVGAWLATRQDGGETTATPIGGELLVTPTRGWRALLRGSFDAESEEFERFDLLTRYQPRRDLPVFTLQYIDRKPIIEASSFFSIFADDLERVSLLRGSARYELENGFGGEIEAARSSVDDRDTDRFGLAVLVPYVRVGLAATSGDAGEDFRWYGDAHYRFFDRVDVSAGAVFAEYALVEDAPDDLTRELVTAFARARVELVDGLRLRAEVQSLENPLFSEDTRVLLGLDLMAGRGATRFGLGSGGE